MYKHQMVWKNHHDVSYIQRRITSRTGGGEATRYPRCFRSAAVRQLSSKDRRGRNRYIAPTRITANASRNFSDGGASENRDRPRTVDDGNGTQ